MKFACARCGKRYVSAEPPAPRRVYRITCRACGHLIEVKAPDPAVERPAQRRREPLRAEDLFGEDPGLGARPEAAPAPDQLAPRGDGGAARSGPASEEPPHATPEAAPRTAAGARRALLVAAAFAAVAGVAFVVW